MHELSVTENILAIAEKHARKAGATRVTDIHIVIGQLSSIVDDSVQFYWDMISEGTLCTGAKLHFSRKPAQMHCRACQHTFTLIRGELIPCPKCSSMDLRIVSGEEFFLDSIEIERDQPDQEP